MYVIFDKEVGEYLQRHGDWIGPCPETGTVIPEGVRTYETREDALSGLEDVLSAWVPKYSVPPVEEFDIVQVKPTGFCPVFSE